MKLYLILIILFISTFAQAEVVNTVKLGTPIRNLDSVTLAIEGYSFYITPQKIDIVRYDDVLKYAKDITPEQIEFMRYKLESYDVSKFTDIKKWASYIVTYGAVLEYAKQTKVDRYEDIIRYIIADLSPEQIKLLKYQIESYDITKFDVTQWVNYIVTYDS